MTAHRTKSGDETDEENCFDCNKEGKIMTHIHGDLSSVCDNGCFEEYMEAKLREPKHTPTPWRAYKTVDFTTIEDALGKVVMLARFNNDEAVDFIVRAVTAYEELLAACKKALSSCEADLRFEEEESNRIEIQKTVDQLNAAIKKAEGK